MSDQHPHQALRYGPHSLQTITIPTLHERPTNGLWLILIHGGAWRDPTQTATNYLTPALSILQSNPSYKKTTLPHITGIASISYRLSAHPEHPQDPQTTDPNELRDAKHPDHLHDVQAALKLLQETYGFGERYILAGHSCGATLAFQCVMDELQVPDNGGGGGIARPLAILGTEGIYDLRLLRDTHNHINTYQEFIEGAFGSDETVWDAASPGFLRGENGIGRSWRYGLAVLAQSQEDSLIDRGQAMALTEVLTEYAHEGKRRRMAPLLLHGEHDEPWEKGEEFARAIADTVRQLKEMELI